LLPFIRAYLNLGAARGWAAHQDAGLDDKNATMATIVGKQRRGR
jgi:hypothetical protein